MCFIRWLVGGWLVLVRSCQNVPKYKAHWAINKDFKNEVLLVRNNCFFVERWFVWVGLFVWVVGLFGWWHVDRRSLVRDIVSSHGRSIESVWRHGLVTTRTSRAHIPGRGDYEKLGINVAKPALVFMNNRSSLAPLVLRCLLWLLCLLVFVSLPVLCLLFLVCLLSGCCQPTNQPIRAPTETLQRNRRHTATTTTQ